MSGHKGKPAEIARDLRDAIAAGSLAVGSVLPTELELCARYGVSRHSVRIAIAELAEAGLVVRRKRFGTVVQAEQPARSFRHTVASVDDLVQYGADHVRSVQKTGLVTAGPALAQDLGCAVGARWYCVASLRFDPGTGPEPLGLTEVYVDPAFEAAGAWARQSPGRLISSFVAERTGRPIARIKQDVTAMLIDRRLAALLVVEAGSPALRIVRHYLDDAGGLMVGSVSVHPASRFRVSSMLERVGAG